MIHCSTNCLRQSRGIAWRNEQTSVFVSHDVHNAPGRRRYDWLSVSHRLDENNPKTFCIACLGHNGWKHESVTFSEQLRNSLRIDYTVERDALRQTKGSGQSLKRIRFRSATDDADTQTAI
jgi:hypothetical protein